MALSDKNIVITPNKGNTSDPQIVFSAADANTTAQQITVKAYPTSNGTLSFEASNGQLFSITNSFVGTIFSVNDISGIPSIEVQDTGDVKIAQYGGNIYLGGSTAVKIPVGTTAQQPSSPVAGMLRFSSSNTSFEGYNGTTWGTIGGATISDDTSTSATYYPVFVTATTGSASTVKISSTKLNYNPSTGTFTSNTVTSNTITSKVVVANTYTENYSSPSISTNTLTLDLSAAGVFNVSLNANITTLTLQNIPTSGNVVNFILIFTADGTSRSVTWPASFKWVDGTAPSISSGLNKKDVFTFFTTDNGTSWNAFISGQGI